MNLMVIHMKINKIYLLLVCTIFSCNNPKYESSTYFQTKEKLEAEYIKLSTIVSPTFFMIQANYLCIYSLQKDTIIDMFSLPDLYHVKSFGTKGRGPGEFLYFPWPCKSTKDGFYVRGYTPLIIRRFLIDPSINLIQVDEFKLKEYESFGSMHIVQDSLLIYLSMGNQNVRGDQISINKYNLYQEQETGKILIPTISPENASIDPNRAGGFDANDSVIVYAYLFKKQIDIYNIHTMELINRLTFNTKNSNSIDKNFEENILQYAGVIAGEKYFFALYNKGGLKINELQPASRTIEVFDYSGNAIAEYSFDDHISLFAIDEKNHILYVYDVTNEDYILKYVLPKATAISTK